MKRHLIKFIGSAEMDYNTSTYCRLNSDEWSEEFGENVDATLTQDENECTCKRCLKSFKREMGELNMKIMDKIKLEFGEWLDKYFEKDNDHTYYSWTYTDDGMHPNDKTRWKDDDLLNEYERYLSDDKGSHVGLDEYDE